jgi:hypothetical protein
MSSRAGSPVRARRHARAARGGADRPRGRGGLTTRPTRERLEQLGYEPVGSAPGEFAAFFAAELPRVAELVRISGASVD